MADTGKALLIKRYASRRLYNTETSDYVTLEDIAGFIREGREVQIIDLKSGDDLTRQYLLQIIAEHESRGENVLPINVLTDLVRSYSSQAQSMVPDFLAMSFEMLQNGQSKVAENLGSINPLASMPGFEAMKAQQQAFLNAMTGGWNGQQSESDSTKKTASEPTPGTVSEPASQPTTSDDLSDIKKQLAELQTKLSRLAK
ncbi:MAG: polyhydroxyalkanoate synthesis repressor PhaR [Halocynthiibacter sp.]